MADGGLARMVQDLRITANIPPPAENFRAIEDGLANIFIFEIRPGGNGRTLVYRYDVELKEVERDRSLTKASGDDGKRGLMRDICYQLVHTTFMNTNAFNSGGQAQFVYDNRKILYTNIRVNPMVCQLTPERMNEYCRRFLHNATVTFELQPCTEESAHELDLNDLGRALQSAPHEQADHSLRTFLEMLTSQPFINAGTHTALGSGRLFERKEHKRLTDAICAHKGISKGVRIIVNGDVKPCPAMVTDVKTCAFFVQGNLETIANAMISNAQRRRRLNPNNAKEMETFWKDFGQLYKGVSAYLSYNPARVIVIDSITKRNCGDISFDIDGRSTSMVEFYRGKNENINPNMPAVRQHVERDSVYPLKCLHILQFQRVSLDKMSLNEDMAQISKELLTENATRPEVRFAAIDAEMRKLGAEGDPAKFMRQFYVRLKGARNDVQLGMLALPNIKFGHSEQRQDDRGRFDVRGPMKYLEPSKCLNTWVVAHPRKIQQDRINRFIQQLMNMGRQRGMQIPDPVFELMELNQFEEKMQQFAQRKVNFFVYIDNKYTRSHAPLKLLERRFNILTQHVTYEMMEKSGPASISNVLGKMNMKLFGQNYVPIFNPACRDKFDLASGKVLVIGIDTSRPPRSTAFEKHQLSKVGVIEGLESDEPMVVGICSNFLANPVKFVGDFYYQPCVQDVLNGDYLIEKMQWLFNQMKGNKRSPPQTIMVIRDGVSEGMVPNLLRTEFDAFVEGCNRFSRGWRPKFVYSIVDKRHNKRFFQKAQNGNGRNGNGNGAVAANTMPGAVVDRKFTRVDMHELFLQAHFPLKGCAKIPQYVFPVNEIRANNNELQAFLHGLCNMWQIVNLAPALPTPVLQAKELAKRGRNNFVEFKRNNASIVPYLPAQQQNQRIRILDYQALNRMISYQEQALVRTRFNA